MLPVHQVWPKPSCKAQWKGEEDKADRGRGGKTTSGNGQAWSSPSPKGQWSTGNNGRKKRKNKNLVAKSFVVPQRPSRLGDWWWWWWALVLVEFTSDEIHNIWSRACKMAPDLPFSLILLRWKISDFIRMVTGIAPFARTGGVSLFVRRPVVDKAGRYGRLIQFPPIPAPAISWHDHLLWKDGTIFSLWV